MDRSSVAFDASQELFEQLTGFLGGEAAGLLEHGELEQQIEERGRLVLCQLMQDRLDLSAAREAQVVIRGVDGVRRVSVERDRSRRLATVFGTVVHTRMAYRQRGVCALHPADSALNLPVGLHSHGLRFIAAVESTRGSFDDATEQIAVRTGSRPGKRQVIELALLAAQDVEHFYETRQREPTLAGDALVLSVDGKGIVMRPDSLRACTAAKAASEKLKTRLSKGEKRNRKRMAEVGAVYEVTPVVRTGAAILATDDEQRTPAPRAKNKWLTASVEQEASEVIAKVFDEAERRDPASTRTTVALVDGNQHQINRIHAEAKQRGRDTTILIDFVHVLEYIWSAAWCFYPEGDPAAEAWVTTRAHAVLDGNAQAVARCIKRFASRRDLPPDKRRNADKCANYLENQAPYLDYPAALQNGWPIATGIIEGACRHLVKDRMDLTGARWGLKGAEAILKLRALRSNGDFNEYWTHHRQQEHQRNHSSHYAAA